MYLAGQKGKTMTAIAAKTLGALLCVLFLLTLKPLLRRAAAFVPPPMREAFLKEVHDLGEASHVPKSVTWALIAGAAACFAVGAALTPLAGEASILIGAAVGFLILYPYFFLILYHRARQAVSQPLLERRN